MEGEEGGSHKETAENKGQSFLPYDIMLVYKMFYSASLYCYQQDMRAVVSEAWMAQQMNIESEKLQQWWLADH